MRNIQIKRFGFLGIFLLVLTTATVGFAGDSGPQKLSMASFKSGSGWYVLAQTMSKLMLAELPEGSSIDVLPYSGGVGNLMLLDEGKADLALGFPVETGLALKGLGPYKKKLPDLKVLINNLDTYWYLFCVRDGVPIRSFRELKEKKPALRLVVLPKGSSGDWDTQTVLGAYGITYEDIESWGGKVTHVSFPTAVAMVKDGQADAFAQVATPGHPAWTQLATTTKIRFLPVDQEVGAKLGDKYGFRMSSLPKGAFRGVDEEVPVLGFSTVLVTTDKMPEDVAYKVTKAICSNKEQLVSAYKGAKAFDPSRAAQGPLPLHPGAQRYYREVGQLK